VTEGTGPALLLIHGFPTSSWDWHKVWSTLKHSYQLLALDLVGFGYSDKPSGYPYSIFDQADLIEQLMNHLGIRNYDILAHDVGDTIAQELLARQMEQKTGFIRSCCLLNGGLFPETHRPTATQQLLLSPLGGVIARLMSFERFKKSFLPVFGARSKPDEDELQNFYRLIRFNNGARNMHRLIRYITERRQNRERWLAALRNFSPLRLINGLEDPVSGAHMVSRYRELIPNPDVVELPGVGHYPQSEAPEQVLDAYQAFRNRR
jgi:pimeloyl-ACP methyl ester carboxylesterase